MPMMEKRHFGKAKRRR